MAHADDATKSWVSAKPKVNDDGNATTWDCQYKYTLNSFSHTFEERVKIETPSKAPSAYTKAELLTFLDTDHWEDMFNKKYVVSLASVPVETKDRDFDINTLDD